MRVIRLLLLLLVALTIMSNSGCKEEDWNPFVPRTEHKGVIKNLKTKTLCQVWIDGEEIATNVLPNQVFVSRKELNHGHHTFAYSILESDGTPVVTSHSYDVDDVDDQTKWGFENMGWWWAIGGSFHG